MRLVLIFCLLALAIGANIGGQDRWGNDGSTGFDLDWFWIGSNLRSIGKPKFKISEHPDGYSAEFGYDEHYMRVRFTEKDRSIDFNVLDHKGSAKLKFDRREAQFTAEANLAGAQGKRSPIDGKFKVQYTGRDRPDAPIVIDVSFSNSATVRSYMYLPETTIREVDKIEASLKIVIIPEDMTNSYVEFKTDIRATEMLKDDDENKSYWEKEWLPGNFGLHGKLTVKALELESPKTVKPTIMKGVLELSETKTFDQDRGTFFNQEKRFAKKIAIDGLINLSGDGKRLVVLKASDADTDRTMCRVQVKRADKENVRVELFGDGQERGALNLQHGPTSMSLTVEDSSKCDDADVYDGYGGNSTTISANGTNYPSNGREPKIYGCINGMKTNINRVYETEMTDDGLIICRVYQDVFYIGHSDRYRERMKKRGLVFEQKTVSQVDFDENDVKSETGLLFSDGYTTYGMAESCKTVGEKTTMEVEATESFEYSDGDVRRNRPQKLTMEIDRSNSTGDANLKLKYNDERIFDGWFYMIDTVNRAMREHRPTYMSHYTKNSKESHSEMNEMLLKRVP